MEVDEIIDPSSQMLDLVSQLLSSDNCDNIIKRYKKHLPEIINQAGEFVKSKDDRDLKNRFFIVSARLLIFNRFLKHHLEPWLCEIGAPWSVTEDNEPDQKKFKLDPSIVTDLLRSCYHLLVTCDRLRSRNETLIFGLTG